MFQVSQTQQRQRVSHHPPVAQTHDVPQEPAQPDRAMLKLKRQRRWIDKPQTKGTLLISGVFFLVALKISQVLISEALHFSTPTQEHPPVTQVRPPRQPQPARLQQRIEALFATPDSLGAIAVGVAEGTRTPDGGKTASWESHIDRGNGKTNRGTFSWQHEAASAADADDRALQWVRREVIPRLLQEARREGITLNVSLLVQGVDLWTQAPRAGADFVRNLKRCQEQGRYGGDVVLCARVEGYVDPQSGQLQARGLDNDFGWLLDDQTRRATAIRKTLQSAEHAQRSF